VYSPLTVKNWTSRTATEGMVTLFAVVFVASFALSNAGAK
jgi:hypothetical protein